MFWLIKRLHPQTRENFPGSFSNANGREQKGQREGNLSSHQWSCGLGWHSGEVVISSSCSCLECPFPWPGPSASSFWSLSWLKPLERSVYVCFGCSFPCSTPIHCRDLQRPRHFICSSSPFPAIQTQISNHFPWPSGFLHPTWCKPTSSLFPGFPFFALRMGLYHHHLRIHQN